MIVTFLGKLGDLMGRQIEIETPEGLATVDDLLDWLGGQYPAAVHGLSDPRLKAVVDDEIVRGDASIAGARQVEFFPLVCGG